jgi:hypothetical protein
MSDIAKTMVERIRTAAGESGTLLTEGPTRGKTAFAADMSGAAPTGKAARSVPAAPEDRSGSINGRQLYIVEASKSFADTYGVQLATVTATFVTKNDILYAAAEQDVPVSDFVKTVGSQFSFVSITGKHPASVADIAMENNFKLALAEFAAADDDWTFSDGFVVSDDPDGAKIIGPHFDEPTSTWQFSSFTAPCSKDEFVKMSPSEKASTPAEDRVFGDIDECLQQSYVIGSAPAAMRM